MRTWYEGRRWYGGVGVMWDSWSTPALRVDFVCGAYIEIHIGPFYVGIGRCDPQ